MAAPAITHPFVSAIADDAAAAAAGEVVPSNWNAAHTLADFTGASKLLGAGSAAATPEEISLGAGLTMTGNVLSAASSTTLDGILAAAADQAGISNGDWNIRWNWQKTTDSEIGFRISESAASTNGTGVAQVILQVDTVAASTAVPFKVLTRGNAAFLVSATATQAMVADGTATSPSLAFINGSGYGFARAGPVANSVSVLTNTVVNTSWTFGGECTHVKSSGDAGSYAINIRKSRGTVASPTVITTGDDLAAINALGYVGSTNTYQVAGSIICDSTGTISDSATGIAGIWKFQAAKTGAEPTDVFQINGTEQHTLHQGTAPTITAGGGTSPSIVGRDEACIVTIGTGGVATSVTVTYNTAFTNAPAAVANSDTDIVGFSVAATTTTVTITAAAPFTAGSKISIISRGYI